MMKARVDLYLHGLFISKNFLGGEFHKTFYLATSTGGIMREISNYFWR